MATLTGQPLDRSPPLEMQGSNGSGDPYKATSRTLLQAFEKLDGNLTLPQIGVQKWCLRVTSSSATTP